ncbi:MAG: molybdenum cofactor guanylyltransferase, partial [Ilumatobacteraceae bacterium]
MAPLSGTHPPGGVAGAVLCGGASSRMGSPKPLVEWHGVAMARRVADVLVAAGCEPVRCVGGDAAALADLGLDTVTDLMPGEGPLGGVLTALRSSGVDAVLVVSCDIPMLTAQTAARLLDEWRSGGAQVVVAHTDRAQPLCAVWGRTVEPAIA